MSEQVYLAGNRLFMIIKTTDDFSSDENLKGDSESPEMRKWEEPMSKYQKPLRRSRPGEEWVSTEKIFEVR